MQNYFCDYHHHNYYIIGTYCNITMNTVIISHLNRSHGRRINYKAILYEYYAGAESARRVYRLFTEEKLN